MRRVSFEEAKAHAVDRLEDILARLYPGGQLAGGTYMPRNPTRNDAKPGSFVIYTRGKMRGAFIEFANRDQEKGDAVDLVSYALAGGVGFKDRDARLRAIDWIADLFRLSHMPSTARAASIEAARRRITNESTAEATLERRRDRARRMWDRAAPALFGTPAELYLRTRGIELAELEHMSGDLRYADQLEWWLGRQKEGGFTKQPGPMFAAIITAMRDGAGAIQAVHCTFLKRDGSGKAPVAKPKLIFPAYAGCVMRLTNGESGLTPEEAIAAGVVGATGIAEGLEDGLTLALGAPGLRVWAAAALSNIGNVPALACTDAFLLHRQNDWQSRTAIAAFDGAKRALEATGRPVAEVAAFRGKDLNDTLRGA